MSPRFFTLISMFALALNEGVAEDQKSVRQVFVPAKTEHGASWSALHKGGPGEPFKDRWWLQAWAGVGDKFPVQEEGKPVLFEIAVVAGDDNQLSVEVRSKIGVLKLAVGRDKRTMFESGGVRYELLYPSTSKPGKVGEKPTTNQVMLFLTRVP